MEGGRESYVHDTGRLRTCPNASPFQWHRGKSHTALEPMAGDIKHCVRNIRIVRIQDIANDDENERKSYAECV